MHPESVKPCSKGVDALILPLLTPLSKTFFPFLLCTDGLCHPHSVPPATSSSSDPFLSLAIIPLAAMPSFFPHFMLPPSSGWLPRQRRHVHAAHGHCRCLRSPPRPLPFSRALACASSYETRDSTSHWSHASMPASSNANLCGSCSFRRDMSRLHRVATEARTAAELSRRRAG